MLNLLRFLEIGGFNRLIQGVQIGVHLVIVSINMT